LAHIEQWWKKDDWTTRDGGASLFVADITIKIVLKENALLSGEQYHNDQSYLQRVGFLPAFEQINLGQSDRQSRD
jgi:hypothetical protein